MKKIPFPFDRNKDTKTEQAAQVPPVASPPIPAQVPSKHGDPSFSHDGSFEMHPPKDYKNLDAVEGENMRNIPNRVRSQPGQNVFVQPLDFYGGFVVPTFPKSDAAIQFIDESLADNFIFDSLSPRERRRLIDAMMMEAVPAGSVIIQQGQVGDYFYVVEEGHIHFSVDGNHVGACSPGGSFGELALLYNCPRAATCVANTDCRLWKVDQSTFRHKLTNCTANQQKQVHAVLRMVPFLAELDDSSLVKISDCLSIMSFPAGERIINKADVGEVFFIIQDGTVKVHEIGFGKSQYVDQVLGVGDWFGERALLTGERRVVNVTATSNCSILCLSRSTFKKILVPLPGLVDNAMNVMKKRVLMSVPIFANSHFQPYEMARLADLVQECAFRKGDILAEQGKPAAQNLYMIRTGRIVVANDNGVITTLVEGDCFGDTSLKDPEDSLSRQTISARANTTCGVLSKTTIEGVIGDINRLAKPLPPVVTTRNKSICCNARDKFRSLGVGSFGKVWLASIVVLGGISYWYFVLRAPEYI